MAKRRSSVKGAAAYRRFLKQLPDSADVKFLGLLNQAGPSLADGMRARLPVLRSPRKDRVAGAARAAVSWKVTPSTKNLKVGILTRQLARGAFYAHILDVGRRAGAYVVKRNGPRKGNTVRLPAMQPLRLVYQGVIDFRNKFLPDYRKITNEILLDAARGAGND